MPSSLGAGTGKVVIAEGFVTDGEFHSATLKDAFEIAIARSVPVLFEKGQRFFPFGFVIDARQWVIHREWFVVFWGGLEFFGIDVFQLGDSAFDIFAHWIKSRGPRVHQVREGRHREY